MFGERITKELSDLARPFTLYALSGSSAYAIAKIAHSGTDLSGGAIYAGALLAGVGALYWGKAWENQKVSAHNADVEKVRAQQSPPPAEALKPAPAADAMGDSPALAPDPDELPIEERVQR